VVTEIDMDKLGSCSRRALDIVVFPAPDGDDSTSISPRRDRDRNVVPLFNILHLFSKLFDGRLELQSDV